VQGTQSREVYLEGKAFFSVQKDPQRPFRVHTGPVLTQVLGTSFWVEEAPGGGVEVAVQTGKVEVQELAPPAGAYPNPPQPGRVVLTPNQVARYSASRAGLAVGLVEEPLPLAGPETGTQALIFREVPLGQVVKRIGEAYGVEIGLSGNLQVCPFTADFSQEPFFAKIQLICAALGAEYQVDGVRVVITGSGCDN
jgi:transmembrane sensor